MTAYFDTCERCGGKGYLEDVIGMHAGFRPQIKQCCNISKYSDEVRRRFDAAAKEKLIAENQNYRNVLPFRRKDK